MQLTSIVFLVVTTIPPLVAGVGRFRTAKTAMGTQDINVFIGKHEKPGSGFRASWLPDQVSKFHIYESVRAIQVQNLDEFVANRTPKTKRDPTSVTTFEPLQGYRFYINEQHELFRREAQLEDHKYEAIVDRLYALNSVVMDTNTPIRRRQKLYCFLGGEDPGPDYSPVKLDEELGQASGSATVGGDVPVAGGVPVAGNVPVAGDVPVAGGGQEEQEVEPRLSEPARGGAQFRGTGYFSPRGYGDIWGRGLSNPPGPDTGGGRFTGRRDSRGRRSLSERGRSTDRLPSSDRGDSIERGAYGPGSSRALSGDAPPYFPIGTIGNPRPRGNRSGGRGLVGDFENLGI
jgi:hypothetical protein